MAPTRASPQGVMTNTILLLVLGQGSVEVKVQVGGVTYTYKNGLKVPFLLRFSRLVTSFLAPWIVGIFLPTLMHNSSPDKHICGRVDCERLWFVCNAFPPFRLKMTKIDNFARAVARPTKVDSGISTDFWKAQTMLFHRCRNENFRTCFL